MRDIQLKCEFGLELAYHRPKWLRDSTLLARFGHATGAWPLDNADINTDPYWRKDQYRNEVVKALNTLLVLMRKQLFPNNKRGWASVTANDIANETLEVSSPVLVTLGDVEMWWRIVTHLMKDIGLKPHSRVAHSGFGHFHISERPPRDIPDLRSGFGPHARTRIALGVAERPWVVWGFLDWDDNIQSWIPSRRDAILRRDGSWRRRNGVKKGSAVSLGNGTVELRYFEAPRTWPEQRAQVLFADRFSHRCAQGKIPVLGLVDRPKTFATARKRFEHLLEDLSLDPKDYQWTIERNMKMRFLEGKLI